MRWAASTAHPRVSGENLPADHPDQWAEGSSPRERGKQVSQVLRGHTGRLIPA